MNILKIILLASLLGFFSAVNIQAEKNDETVFTYRAAESANDLRFEYDTALLELALQNTADTDGPYKLVPSPVMNFSRAKIYVTQNTLPNFFIKLTYQDSFDQKTLAYVPFPVDLGIVGVRVCFVSPEAKEKVAGVKTLDDLKKFIHGQGKGWTDTIILRHNGFKVSEVGKYENLFKMVAGNRFDLFCRGANELYEEVEAHNHMERLLYDKSLTISYPLPRFFYTNSQNRKALDRIRRGIMIAYENGSMKNLWEEKYRKSIDFAELGNRKIFEIENPLTKGINFDFKQYFYKPSNM